VCIEEIFLGPKNLSFSKFGSPIPWPKLNLWIFSARGLQPNREMIQKKKKLPWLFSALGDV
jgi:hypothetical protein